MEEIELKEILEYYLKKLPIIILTAILVVLIGYLYVDYYQVPMYHGKTTIILIQKNDKTDGNILNETENQLNVNEKLVATYSEIIKSRRVLEQVINNLKLEKTYNTLEDKVSISDVTDTSIIEITVSDKNNEQASLIANEIASVFKTEIMEIYSLENVSIIDEAIVETEPYNVNIPKQLLICGMVGVVLSCIIIFIIYYFDNSIKNKKEIETKLNLPVLGEVPLSQKLLNKEKQKEHRLQKNMKNKEKLEKSQLNKERKLEERALKKQAKLEKIKEKKLQREKNKIKNEEKKQLKIEQKKIRKEQNTKQNEPIKEKQIKTSSKKESKSTPKVNTKEKNITEKKTKKSSNTKNDKKQVNAKKTVTNKSKKIKKEGNK